MADAITSLKGVSFGAAALSAGEAVSQDLPGMLQGCQSKMNELILQLKTLQSALPANSANRTTLNAALSTLYTVGKFDFSNFAQSHLAETVFSYA